MSVSENPLLCDCCGNTSGIEIAGTLEPEGVIIGLCAICLQRMNDIKKSIGGNALRSVVCGPNTIYSRRTPVR